jgi:hypothetical protein
MRTYRASAGTETRLDYGMELVAGLQLFPETEALAPDFEELNSELETANGARRAKRSPLFKARVALRLANYETDQAIKSCGKAAEIADGARKGPVFNALFPKGVGPVIAPAGARQIKPTEALRDRMTTSKAAAVKTFAVEWLPKIQAVLTKLTDAANAHNAALGLHGTAFQEEVALRQEHKLSVDRLMGQVRTAFPGDRAKQDLVFPALEDDGGSGGDSDGGGGEEATDAPTAPVASSSPA